MQIRTIIYPTDFSACAVNALDYAVNLAKLMEAKLILAHSEPELVSEISEKNAPMSFKQKDRKASLEEMREVIHRQSPMLKVETALLQGEHVYPVIDLVDKAKADLIVMGTLGAGGLSQLMIGSYSAKVIEKANCPVLIVPAKASYNRFSKIIYASSLAQHDVEIIKELTDLAKLSNAEVSVLNIHENEDISEDQLFAFEKAVREKALYPKLDFIFFKGKNINTHIQDYSERNNADLIVMNAKKKSFFGKLFDGAHTETMEYHTHIPLLVYQENK